VSKVIQLIQSISVCIVLVFTATSCHDNGKTIPIVEQKVPSQSTIQKEQDPIQLPITDNDKLDSQRNSPENASWKIPPVVFEKIGNLEGQTVADIGAGVGYFSFLMILRKANVIAVDTDPSSLELMNIFAISNLNREQQSKFEARLADPDNPNLSENEVDRVMMMHIVTFLSDRKQYFTGLLSSLKPGGELMIMDFKMKRLDQALPSKEFRIYPDILEEELYSVGFENVIVDDTSLDDRYIVVARNPGQN